MESWQEKLDPRLAGCSTVLQELSEAIESFRFLLKSEYDAIGEHNISNLELVAQKKLKVGEQIESLLRQLQDEQRYFATLAEQAFGQSLTSESGISGLSELVARLLNKADETKKHDKKALPHPILDLITACQEKFWQLKPEVEKNRFVMERLLFHHQQSYQFWQSAVTEASSSYDSFGTRRTTGSISQFSTKA